MGGWAGPILLYVGGWAGSSSSPSRLRRRSIHVFEFGISVMILDGGNLTLFFMLVDCRSLLLLLVLAM